MTLPNPPKSPFSARGSHSVPSHRWVPLSLSLPRAGGVLHSQPLCCLLFVACSRTFATDPKRVHSTLYLYTQMTHTLALSSQEIQGSPGLEPYTHFQDLLPRKGLHMLHPSATLPWFKTNLCPAHGPTVHHLYLIRKRFPIHSVRIAF